MPKTVKLSEELVAIAREEGRVMRRSIGSQIEYWALIGREVEASGTLGPAGIRKLLDGVGSVQRLTERDTQLYLDLLERKLQGIDGSDTRLLDDLRAGGHPIASLDSDGKVVIEKARPTRKRAQRA